MFTLWETNGTEELRIARTRAVLDHALAIQATPTTMEKIGDIVICNDAVLPGSKRNSSIE